MKTRRMYTMYMIGIVLALGIPVILLSVMVQWANNREKLFWFSLILLAVFGTTAYFARRLR